MSELSQHAKLIKAIEIAKGAQVGIELSYFDVLEVAGELNEAKEVVAMLNARIAELEAAQRWIPVSERLPEENVTVLVVTKRNRNPVVAWMRLGLWRSRGVDFALSVTHWMPLPTPPEDK